MSPTSKYFYSSSPFIPLFDVDSITDSALTRIRRDCLNPTIAICLSLVKLMRFHIEKNLLPNPARILLNFGTKPLDLIFLELGYSYPFETIIVTTIYKQCGSKDEAIRESFNETSLPGPQSYIQHIKENLDITRDLLINDITGLETIEYLREKPYIRQDYFDTGLEFAGFVFAGIGLEVANRL